jgi:hypothetical protein
VLRFEEQLREQLSLRLPLIYQLYFLISLRVFLRILRELVLKKINEIKIMIGSKKEMAAPSEAAKHVYSPL